MAKPRTGSLAWHRAEALRRLGPGPVDAATVAALLGAYAHANATLAARLRDLERTVLDVARVVRRLTRVIDTPSPPASEPFFPTLGQDGLVTVKGIPHLPDCARVPRPGSKRTRTPPCTCGSVVDAAKRRAPN